MGQQLSTIFTGLGRFFEYPVKRKPICFYRQEDFTATGEPQKKVSETIKTTMTDYDKLVDLFYKRLTEQRQYNQGKDKLRSLIIDLLSPATPSARNLKENSSLCALLVSLLREMKEHDRRWSMQKVVERFPGWNEVTIANLHSLFLLFDNQSNGMLGFDDFCAVLESLGDETSMETRKEKYNSTDSDNDGWITYDEFLSLVYNFNPPENGLPSGLALLCNEVADNIQFVSNLTVGEQLEYGLF